MFARDRFLSTRMVNLRPDALSNLLAWLIDVTFIPWTAINISPFINLEM